MHRVLASNAPNKKEATPNTLSSTIENPHDEICVKRSSALFKAHIHQRAIVVHPYFANKKIKLLTSCACACGG